MEWNRGGSPTQSAHQPVNHAGGSRKRRISLFSLRSASVLLVACIGILILAVAASIALGGPASQTKYVDGSKMQAVFLNGSATPYFGQIVAINKDVIRLSDIYYLRANQQVQPDGSTATNKDQPLVLVKLGCEVHGPQDSMVINQSQVLFWENLTADGKVAEGIKEIKTKYKGDCKQIEAAAASSTKKAQ